METVTIKVTLEREIELPRDTWEELFDEQLPSKQETLEGKEYCLEHSKTNCVICGEQATHECAETFQFVCGTPLCDKEICKIKHHPNHFKFTPRQWGEIYKIEATKEIFGMKWGTEISFEEFKKEVVRPIQEHVAKVISEQLNKNELFDLHAYYGGKIIGDYDGRRIYIDVSAEL